jgi:ribosomal protein S1
MGLGNVGNLTKNWKKSNKSAKKGRLSYGRSLGKVRKLRNAKSWLFSHHAKPYKFPVHGSVTVYRRGGGVVLLRNLRTFPYGDFPGF